MRIKWIIAPRTSGAYYSFHRRSWPLGEINDAPVFSISCNDSYDFSLAKTGNHAPLTLAFSSYRPNGKFIWVNFKKKFATLAEAKKAAESYLKNNKEYFDQYFSKKPFNIADYNISPYILTKRMNNNETILGVFDNIRDVWDYTNTTLLSFNEKKIDDVVLTQVETDKNRACVQQMIPITGGHLVISRYEMNVLL